MEWTKRRSEVSKAVRARNMLSVTALMVGASVASDITEAEVGIGVLGDGSVEVEELLLAGLAHFINGLRRVFLLETLL